MGNRDPVWRGIRDANAEVRFLDFSRFIGAWKNTWGVVGANADVYSKNVL
jgi:hypothetical protein